MDGVENNLVWAEFNICRRGFAMSLSVHLGLSRTIVSGVIQTILKVCAKVSVLCFIGTILPWVVKSTS